MAVASVMMTAMIMIDIIAEVEATALPDRGTSEESAKADLGIRALQDRMPLAAIREGRPVTGQETNHLLVIVIEV